MTLLIDPEDLATLLGVSRGTIENMRRDGRLPAHVDCAGPKWRRAEIEAWTEAGCPGKANWKWEGD